MPPCTFAHTPPGMETNHHLAALSPAPPSCAHARQGVARHVASAGGSVPSLKTAHTHPRALLHKHNLRTSTILRRPAGLVELALPSALQCHILAMRPLALGALNWLSRLSPPKSAGLGLNPSTRCTTRTKSHVAHHHSSGGTHNSVLRPCQKSWKGSGPAGAPLIAYTLIQVALHPLALAKLGFTLSAASSSSGVVQT
jgi:hypothetical protein